MGFYNLHRLESWAAGDFGSNLSRNISPNTTKIFTHVLTMSSNRQVSKFYKQSSEWAKLMTSYSTAQPIETHRKLAGLFP